MVNVAIKSPVWDLTDVVVEQQDTTSRVSVELDGDSIWFESDDAVLAPSMEAFAGTVLLPCLHQGAKLRIGTPVDAQWLKNIQQLCKIYAQWWGYDGDCPIEADTYVSRISPSTETGLCFTGGVDSSFSLFEYPGQVDRLVFAHGYDVKLDDLPRIEAYKKSLAEITALTGKPAIIIRTNLREHPLFKTVSWKKTHGAGLAALGLLLSDQIGGLVIPPSYSSTRLCPWGSHPETDPLFSTARCQIRHHATELGRLERVQTIAKHNLVQKHLRVCNANKSLTGNCSTCEKCVMTMVALNTTGHFSKCTTFNHSKSLVGRVNNLRYASPHLVELWQDIAAVESKPKLKRAIERAINRFDNPPLRSRLRLKSKRFFAKCQRKIDSFGLRFVK